MEKCEDIRHTIGMKGSVCANERDRRAPLRNKKKPRITLYTDDRKSPDGNESRAYVCLHESEKTGKDDSQEGKKGNPKVFIIDQVHTF